MTEEQWWSSFHKNLLNFAEIARLVYKGNESMIVASMINAYRIKDHEHVYEVLENIWADAPDHPKIHDWTGWNVLCDLCSSYEETFGDGK